MILRPATEADVIAWFGRVPASMRAIVVEDEGRVVGIAGISRMDDHLQAFSEIADDLRQRPMTMARAAVAFRRLLAEAPGTVVAVCSPKEPTAPRLLTRLGFEQYSERGWVHG